MASGERLAGAAAEVANLGGGTTNPVDGQRGEAQRGPQWPVPKLGASLLDKAVMVAVIGGVWI